MKFLIATFVFCVAATVAAAEELYTLPAGVESRWVSFENPTGAPGAGGQTNKGAKGAAFGSVAPGEEKVLLDMDGSGVVRRMWFTLSNRSAQALRSYVIRMYWDGAEKPAVEAPFPDFFGHILGEMKPFESELFSSPEGRSFNCVVPMPFRTHAKITFTNDAAEPLDQLFYDINLTVGEEHPDNVLYFHAFWHRDPRTALGKDFEILPQVTGGGRFLGAHIGILGAADNVGWWGEGEVKMYLDGDTAWPTIIGTGTEDYVGTAYGQGEFANRYQGSLIIENQKRRWTFYRHHVPDPVYFHQEARVTIQQMGGADKKTVERLVDEGVEVEPVSVQRPGAFVPLLEQGLKVNDPSVPDGWTNMYRRDDVSAVALFYLDQPSNALPAIQPVAVRTEGIGGR
ncbi:MAG: DUF2961 domain-containing protein [Candidatus Hydrogenedens sp.]|nr:DUF2961 domain-containing protein [Candidatus Hydrogenedens sp.]